MVSEIHKNDLFCPYNPPKIRNAFIFFRFLLFLVLALFSKSSFMDTSAFFFDKSETTFSKHCFLIFLFLFCNLNSKISWNMCTWRHKVCKGPMLPHQSPNFWNYFFSVYIYGQKTFFTNLQPHNQNSFFLHIFFCFLFQASGYLETCVNGVTNYKTSKRALFPLLPGEMKLDLREKGAKRKLRGLQAVYTIILLTYTFKKIR